VSLREEAEAVSGADTACATFTLLARGAGAGDVGELGHATDGVNLGKEKKKKKVNLKKSNL
jgi:hypothetical protein